MMFGRQRGANVFGIFKSLWHRDSSLTTGLLEDVPQEVELSSYGRAPSPGSESPSGLLNGEDLSVEPIADLDLFFERLYNYYCEKGLWCIIIKWVVELLSLCFTICFSGFFLLIVDWNGLRNAKCGMDAVESGIKPCDLAREALHQHPLTPFTLSKAVIVGYLGIFSLYWIFCFLKFFAQLKDTLGIRHFYYNSLHVTDNEIQTMPWASILEKVVQIQNSQKLCVVKDLSEHDVVMRLMRKENYLIGMLNKGVLAFPVSQWVPGSGPTVRVGSDGMQHRLVLTKTLEWTLNWFILQSMFDRNFCVKVDFISNPETLKRRLMIVGLAMLLLSPFLVIFMLVYLFLRHAEQFYNHPTTASSRRWSNLSKWIFREYNEVDHLFKHRINSSVEHASVYLKQFPSPIISMVAKLISFVSGGFAAILIIIAFLEESLLEGHIFGRNLLWYAAVFGTITAIGRAAIADELLVLDPKGAMSVVVQHTHYMPKKWRGKENTEFVRIEFETLFQYTAMMLLEEMASIFLTPFLLLFVVPKRVDHILQFIADFTVRVEGVGHVCSFHSCYPSWVPNDQGKQFLTTLRTFREQKFQEKGVGQAISLPGAFHGSSNLSQGNQNNLFSREMPQNNLRTVYQNGWVVDIDEKNHPYLLDWYYTCQPHRVTHHSRDITEAPFGIVEEGWRDLWMPTNLTRDDAEYEEGWVHPFVGRLRGHLEASTSAPFFEESILQHHDSGRALEKPMSHWWARSDPEKGFGGGPEASFLEPPVFNQHALNECDGSADRPEASFLEPPVFNQHALYECDGSGGRPEASILDPLIFNQHAPYGHDDNNLLERSTKKQGQHLDWRNLQRLSWTNFMDDFNTRGEVVDSFSERNPDEQRQQHLDWRNSPGLSQTTLMDDFNTGGEVDDNILERSAEGQDEQHLDWRKSHRLSRTTIMDDFQIGGEVSLHFDDIYSRSQEHGEALEDHVKNDSIASS